MLRVCLCYSLLFTDVDICRLTSVEGVSSPLTLESPAAEIETQLTQDASLPYEIPSSGISGELPHQMDYHNYFLTELILRLKSKQHPPESSGLREQYSE